MERRLIDFGQGHGNKRRSIVPIDDQLLEALREAKELACTPYVIEHNGRRVHSIKTAFRAAARRAGMTGISPHTLRHTAAFSGHSVTLQQPPRLRNSAPLATISY